MTKKELQALKDIVNKYLIQKRDVEKAFPFAIQDAFWAAGFMNFLTFVEANMRPPTRDKRRKV